MKTASWRPFATSSSRRTARLLFHTLALADWRLRFSRLFERSLSVILMYHAVDAADGYAGRPHVALDQFRRQVALLNKRYECSTLRDLFQDPPPPRKRVVLSFDDGYRSFIEKALPVLTAHAVPATVFVSSGLLGTERFLTRADVKDLASTDTIEIGNHTRTHIDLGAEASSAILEREIVGGKEDLEDLLGAEVNSFAYPWGRVTAASASLVHRSHRLAVTTAPGVVRPGSDRLALNRVNISGTTISRFAFELTDLWQTLRASTAWRVFDAGYTEVLPVSEKGGVGLAR